MNSAADPTGTIDKALAHTRGLLESNPVLAAEQASEILKVAPNQPVAMLLLAVARRMTGDMAEALAILERLTAAHPGWAAAHYEFGAALGDAGAPQAAVVALRRAVSLKPDLPDAWRDLGDQLTVLKDAEGADAQYARHIKTSNKDPRLIGAAFALCENEIPKAEFLLREHLKKYPTDVAAIRMFAEVAGRLRRYRDAEFLLARCLELAPGFNAARYNYAMALYRQNRAVAALQQIDLLMAAEPRNSGYRNLRAVVLANIGEYRESLEIYADVLAKHPDQARIWMSYGHALATAGRLQDSVAAYRRGIALIPTLGEAYYSLANLKTFRFEETEVQAMRANLKIADLSGGGRARFFISLRPAAEGAGRE